MTIKLRGLNKVNQIEKALLHGLFIHLHHNIDQVIDFKQLAALNEKVAQLWPEALLIGPEANDDAAVFSFPGEESKYVAKMESHCSPGVPRPYDAAATGAGGAMRDIVAMGARPLFLLDFVGTRPLDEEVLVGTCGFAQKCSCGQCEIMTSGERLNLIIKGIKDMCAAMDVFVVGGGLSTSFSDIVPAIVVACLGKLVIEKPLTKPAKKAGHQLIVIGETNNDGNDTLYRAGLAAEMRPAQALFAEERAVMEVALKIFQTKKVQACSDLGAGGIGAGVCESARFGGLGAIVNLDQVPVKNKGLTPQEILICETQARMMIQVETTDVEEVLAICAAEGVPAAHIGEINSTDQEVFKYKDEIIATIPNQPSAEELSLLRT